MSLLCGFVARAERLPVKLFTSADGLGSSFVNYITSDSKGFLWICTRDGLSRFDGSRFITYQLAAEGAAPGIEHIVELKEGIYLITTTSGTYLFDPAKTGPTDSDAPKLDVELLTAERGSIIQDRSGTIWMGSGKLFKIVFTDGKASLVEVPIDIPAYPSRLFSVAALDEGPDGSIWFNTTWGLVRRLPDSRLVYYPPLEGTVPVLSSITVDKGGRVWLTAGNLLQVLKPEPIESFPPRESVFHRSLEPTSRIAVVPGQPVTMPRHSGEVVRFTNAEHIDRWKSKSLFTTSDGTVWVSAENVLLQFAEGTFQVFTDAQGFPSVMARMGEDAAGNLWIGGQTVLARLDRHGMVMYAAEPGLNSSRYFSIGELPDGTLFFGKRDFYVSYFDGTKFKDVHPRVSSTAGPTWTSRIAFRSSDGDWWLLSNENLYRYSGVSSIGQLDGREPTKKYTTADGLKGDGAFQIYEDKNGDIWVSTRGNTPDTFGLSRRIKYEDRFETFNESHGLPSGRSISSFAEDKFGNLWITFYEGGMARFDGEQFKVLDEHNGIPSSNLLSDVHIDAKGRMWVSSSAYGLFTLDDLAAEDPIFVPYKPVGRPVSNNIRTITEDRFGRIYLGTARGVERISPDTGYIKRFSVNDGLAADFVVDSYRDQRGDLWFATHNGLSRLSPIPDEVRTPPQVFLGGIRIAGNAQPLSELGVRDLNKGDLVHSDNNLQIDFFGLDFCAGETLRYQYKLEGADEDWSPATDLRTVTFANLTPGAYRFLVRAVNSDGAASELPATLTFKILPPIWQRWWFMLIAALLVGGTVIAFYKYRMSSLHEINVALSEARTAEERLRKAREERLAELEKVRSRIATDLHDDIGASLTQITILSEVARTQNGGSNGSSQDPLAKITDVSNELVGAMSDIVWAINPTKDHLSDLTQRMRRFASDVLPPNGIEFRFLAPESQEEVMVGSNLRREVFLVFKESINNIVKHSGAKNVRIELGIAENELHYHISDDGHGFDLSNPGGSGNGLASMRKRAGEIGGRLQVMSEPNTGTSVSLSIPLERPAAV